MNSKLTTIAAVFAVAIFLALANSQNFVAAAAAGYLNPEFSNDLMHRSLLPLAPIVSQSGPALSLHGNGKIAFTSTRDGNLEIYVMNPDGSDQIRLTNSPGIDDHPKWSPNGKKIAYLSQDASGAFAIFIMNPDGSSKTEITPTLYWSGTSPLWWSYWDMSWSPDGQQIVFSDVTSWSDSTTVIVNADGSNRRTLAPGFYPAWSPDGTRILLLRRGATFRDATINTVNPDGTNFQTVRVQIPSYYYLFVMSVAWSPNGRRIAFTAGNSANASMFVMTADGSDLLTFIDECGGVAPDGCGLMAGMPTWSPNGRSIAFSYSPYSPQIAVRNIGEQTIRYLTNSSAAMNGNPNWQPVSDATADFDGDGRSDISVFRPSDRTWYLNRSTDGISTTQFGLSTDKITPADYDNDNKTDISVYRDGIWYWLKSSDNTIAAAQFGIASDIPVPADLTGDGRSELAVYRNGMWWALDLSTNQIQVISFGAGSDKPVPADYDGDGVIDQAVYRNGEWHLKRSTLGYTVINFGLASDRPVVGDYDGDGRTDIAVFRPTDRNWYIQRSSDDAVLITNWGWASDRLVPADYDGDGRTDIAVFRGGTWYIIQSSTGQINYQQFGLVGDDPVPSSYSP